MPGFEPRDLLRFQFVGDPQLSPDGTRLAWVHTVIDARENVYRSRIFTGTVAGAGSAAGTPGDPGGPGALGGPGGQPKPFTAGPSDRSPRWSPDGRLLAFLRTTPGDGAEGRTQIWVMPADGGEARPVTFIREAPGEIAWAPDSRRLAFVARVGPEGLRPARGAGREDGPGRDGPHNDGPQQDGSDLDALDRRYNADVRHIRRIWYRQDGLGYLGDRRAHVFVVDVAAALEVDDPERLPLPAQVTGGDYDHHSPAWSPDGRCLAVAAVREPGAEFADYGDIWVFTVDGSEPPRKITRSLGPARSPAWSPDGRQVAYLGDDRPVDWYSNTCLWVAAADGSGEPRCLTAGFDRSFANEAVLDMKMAGGDGRPVWSPDGRYLYAAASLDGQVHLVRVEVAGGGVQQLTRGERVIFDWSVLPGCGLAAVAAASPDSPNDIYLARLPGPGETPPADGVPLTRLTRANRDLLAQRQVSMPEKFQFRAQGGPLVDGWVIRPVDFDPARRYPAVLQIHGGPMAMYTGAFFFEFQLLASAGIAVIYTNPRGSQGYGQDFCAGIRGNWGANDYADLMAGVDAALARFPWIDPERLGVAGGSYGGYMTAWITGHTDRFKAACVMRAVTNCYSFFGTSDGGYRWDRIWGAGQPPWENPEDYLRQSPISYVGRVRTPTLVIHSEEDHRCLIEQGEQWYVALRRQGVEAEFLRFPGETHELSRSGKPWHRVHRLRAIVNWFIRWLEPEGQQPYPVPAGAGARP